MAAAPGALKAALLGRYGRTYAEDAGIRLADKPAPLYQLLVLATLLSARISSDIAITAARELFAAGYTTPKAMQEASWQERVDALGRAHYRRYDERTATMLGDGGELLNERWHGDLRGQVTTQPGIGNPASRSRTSPAIRAGCRTGRTACAGRRARCCSSARGRPGPGRAPRACRRSPGGSGRPGSGGCPCHRTPGRSPGR
jgi:hypothetical protein